MRIEPSLLAQSRDRRQFDHQLLAGQPLICVILRCARYQDGKACCLRKANAANDQCKMWPGEFVPGGGGEIEMDDVAAVGVIGLLAHRSSLPTRLGIRSGPQIAGVTPFRSSFSVHFFRGLARLMVMESSLTRTLTRSPSFSF